MKYFLLITLFTLIGCTSPRMQNFGGENTKPYIIYIEEEPLQWIDFYAKPDEENKQTALIFTDLVVTERSNVWWGYNYIEVHGIMYPYQSWVKPGYETENKLKYFRTYHKIAELYARKFYVFLESHDVRPKAINQFRIIFENIKSEYINCINQYEKETNYGEDTTSLKLWINKINNDFNNFPTNGSNKLNKLF